MISGEEKIGRKQHLNRMIDGGIEWTRECHAHWSAVRQIYRSYGIQKIMQGEWNSMAGGEEEEVELQYRRIAKKVGVPADQVSSFLTGQIQARSRLILSRYDGGECRSVLERCRAIALSQIESAGSMDEINSIINRISKVIHQCAQKGSQTRAPEIDENCNLRSDLQWQAMVMADIARQKAEETSRPETESPEVCDDEIPF